MDAVLSIAVNDYSLRFRFRFQLRYLLDGSLFIALAVIGIVGLLGLAAPSSGSGSGGRQSRAIIDRGAGCLLCLFGIRRQLCHYDSIDLVSDIGSMNTYIYPFQAPIRRGPLKGLGSIHGGGGIDFLVGLT